jgi:hypothetical protein
VERERTQGYAASLEQIIRHTHLDLRKAMNTFQELCLRVAPERIVPLGILTDIRQTYKVIQDHLTKIRGVNQLLEGKYRQYFHRDTGREREVMEVAFLAKSLYSKFEYTVREIEAKRKLRDTGERFEMGGQRIPLGWFHSKANQIILLRNLRGLYELDYKTRYDLECEQRLEIIGNGMRSVSLFVLSGEVRSIDILHSRMRLREHDIKERFARDELRGALTHLRDISLSEVERVMRRLTESGEFSKLKCILMSIQSQKDLGRAIFGLPEKILQVMAQGEVRTLSVSKSSPE